MGLLYPAGLVFLGLLPLLIIAYLARERPRQVIVSSVLAFRALHVMRGERFGGRPRFTWTFFVELIVLALAALAIAGPYLLRRGAPIAIVLDNSAAMQAQAADGESRFQAAVAELKDKLRGAGGGAVTIFLTAPEPHQEAAALSSAGALSALARIKVIDTPDDRAAVMRLLTELNNDRRWGRIIFASYRPLAPPPPRLTPILVGAAMPNYAIGSFTVARGALNDTSLKARVTVANFSQSPQTLKVALSGDGRPLATEEAQLAAGEVRALEFANVAPARIYRAQLSPGDGFALDNTAFATGSSGQTLSILFVSPAPADGASLKSIPGVAVTLRTPNQYTPKDLSGADLAIFEYTAPKELPAINTLFVMPPPGDPLLGFVTIPAGALRVTAWPSTDPLTDGVNFRLLNVRSGEYFAQHPWMQAVVHGAQGGLILVGDRQAHRYVATGFNPFPYLGKQNLPMSVLTLNLLNDLAGLGAESGGFRTGDAWPAPAGVKTIVAPSGEKIPVSAGASFSADTQGIYELVAPDATHLRAVNLADLAVSDLENVAPIKIEAAAASGAPSNPIHTPIAPYLLAAIIGLIILEALIVYRRRRVIVEA